MENKSLYKKIRSYGLASAVALGIGFGDVYAQNDYEMVHQNNLDKKVENVSYSENVPNYCPCLDQDFLRPSKFNDWAGEYGLGLAAGLGGLLMFGLWGYLFWEGEKNLKNEKGEN